MQQPAQPVLAIPYEEAKSLLTEQILEGESLRNAARRFLGNPKPESVAPWLSKVIIWSDANERLLRRIFASGGVPEEFARKRRAWKHRSSSSASGGMSEALGHIQVEQKELESILSQLPGPAPAEPPPGAPEAEAPRAKEPAEQRKTWHAVRSTSIQDLPASEDLLGFKPYVEAMAAFLANEKTQPPLTLSIEGEWGSGKSSFMLQLEAALRRELKEKARFVRFNAWRHDRGEALWAAFALEFSRQLVEERSWLVRRWMRLRLGLARLRRGQGWLGFLVLFVPLSVFIAASWVHRETLLALEAELKALVAVLTTPLSVPIIKKVWSFFGNPFSVDLGKLEDAPNYESRIPFLEQFHEDFRLLMDSYASHHEKIFVFIDDLDRCEVPKASELLQALNLMIPENSRVIFILGVDREKVAAGIAMRHEKVLPLLAPLAPGTTSLLPYDPALAAAFGRDFLERFLQLPFQLPRPVPERLDGMLDLLLGVSAQEPGTAPAPAVSGDSGAPAAQLWPTSGGAEPLSEATKARRAEMERKAEMDSPEVREVMKRLAPALEFNLRRLKQFLNVFRLSIYIANNTGLFDGGHALTLSQLGKFVAIGLRWPGLLDDLEREPGLLAELEDPKHSASCEATAKWRRDGGLLRLLQAGLEEGGAEHSLKGLDFQGLRSVATAIPREVGGEHAARQSAA